MRLKGPRTLPRPTFEGVLLSDHDPVLADVVPATLPGV